MARHKNRTENGDKLIAKHQATYERWWLNKHIDYSPSSVNGLIVKGKIVKVRYIGNSVYGIVKLILDNGCEWLIGGEGYRPKKYQVELRDGDFKN